MNYLYQLSVAIVAGAFGAWIATLLALRRFYSEKWWEKRAAAFIELTDSIYQMKVTLEYYSELSEYRREGPEEFPNFKELSDNQFREMQDLSSKAHILVIKYSQAGPLLITERASKLLREYLKEENRIENDVHFRGLDAEEAEAHLLTITQRLFEDVLKQSRKELKAS